MERIPFSYFFLQLGRERGEEDSCWTSGEKQRALYALFFCCWPELHKEEEEICCWSNEKDRKRETKFSLLILLEAEK
jgi:hypothetical protein